MAKQTAFILLCIVALSVAIPHGGSVVIDPETKQFLTYIRTHNKEYKSNEEFTQRLANFKDSLKRIALKNKNSKGAVYGINKFSDMSVEEFKSNVLMKNPIVVNNTATSVPKDQVLPKRNVGALPTSLDWREKGAVTAVKDQGQCGSCWAFSATENIESMWLLAGHSNNNTLNLSPQQIVDCDNSDGGCNGGNPPTAYDYVISAGGMEPISDYPYTAEDGSCAFTKSDVVATISSWKYATEFYSESELQNNLVAWGPLSICVDAEAWQDYQSGVMTWEECAYINILDHCVQLVGYNSDASSPYWIVRNSWGADWGVSGYIWLQMGEDTCGIAHEATCAIV